MTVYVVGCDGSRLVKIGWTENPVETRLKHFRVGSPYPLRLLWQSTPDRGAKTEKILHELFDAYRVHGEWFDFGGADPVALISAAVNLPPPPKAQLFPTPPLEQRPHTATPSVARRDLLADLDEVIGDEPVVAPELPSRLRLLAPEDMCYSTMTGKRLIAELAMLGVKVPSTGNRWPVSPSAIRAALASRSTQSHLIDPRAAS